MELNLVNGVINIIRRLYVIILILLLISPLCLNATAEHKEFDVKMFQENVILDRDEHHAINFSFREGNLIEIIYEVKVKEELPVDIWFINEDNYFLLTGGAQFICFLDGTSQKVPYAKKVVILTKHNNYKLVVTNYHSNQTVEVGIIGEIRSLVERSEENTIEFSPLIFYTLISIPIILIFVLIFLGFRVRKYKTTEWRETNKGSNKKSKRDESKKGKDKSSRRKDKDKETRSKANKNVKKNKSEQSDFCGYCGRPIDTPFCKHCGRKG